MPSVSITGGAGKAGVFLNYSAQDSAFKTASKLALQVNQRYGSSTATYYNPASPPTAPGSGLFIDTVNSSAAIDARGFGAVIDDSSAQVTILGGGSSTINQIVLAGSGGLNFRAGKGNDTVVAGGGNNFIYLEPGDTGNNSITTSTGNDTIYAGAGNTTISAGAGHNAEHLAGGNSLVYVSGVDNVTLGEGSATVDVLAGGSASVHGSGPVTVGGYSLTFNGDTKRGALSNTVYGGAGRVSIMGGAGGGLFRGGTEGGNYINGGTGTVTVEGAGPGDTLIGGTGANDFIRAGIGNETLTGGGKDPIFGLWDAKPGQIANSTITITDFKSVDIIRLISNPNSPGMESQAYKHAVQTYHIVGGSGTFQLLDGTTVVLTGYTGGLNHSNLK